MSDDLPPGFVLDRPATKAAPASDLPEGFVLDQQPDNRGAMEKLTGTGGERYQLWPERLARGIAKSATEFVTLPGEVYRGEIDPKSDEALGRTVEGAALASPLSRGRMVTQSKQSQVFADPRGDARAAWEIAGRPAAQRELPAASENIGVNVPRVAASDSSTVQRIGQGISALPTLGAPVRNASREALGQMGVASEKAAGMPTGGTAATPEQAGAAARGALENYIGPVTEARVTKAYDKVGSLVDQRVKTDLAQTRMVAQDIINRRAEGGLEGQGGAKRVMEAVTRPDGLNYEGIKRLRTSINEDLKPGRLPAEMEEAELKQLKGALTQDLKSSVDNAGGTAAKAAFERANTYTRLVNDRRKALDRMMGNEGKSDEGLFSKIKTLAGSTSTADAKLLLQARKSVPADTWDEVASATISRLGKDNNGNFSPALYTRDYANLSETGKRLLFSTTEHKKLRPFLDDLNKVSARFNQLNKLANHSNTSNPLAMAAEFGGGGAAGAALMGGAVAEPLTFLGGVIGAAVLSKALSRPVTASSTAKWARAYTAAVYTPSAGTAANLKLAMQNLMNNLGELSPGRNMQPSPAIADDD